MKVVELAQVMAGPVCGLMLADLGAQVTKVEKPGGDDTRRFLPPALDGISSAYLMINRNKRGMVINLKASSGVEVVRRLLSDADVLIENFRTGTLEGYGLGYQDLRRSHPGLIYCAISGFGRTGPYSRRGGFDLVAQGMSGLMSITGEAQGRPPVKVGAPIADITAGVLAAMGVLAAYVRKKVTGEGGFVDASLFEAGIMHTYWQSAICLATGVSPPPLGSAHPLSAPYQAFQTADAWITVGAANQENWLRLLDVLDLSSLADDDRFSSNELRVVNIGDLQSALTPAFRQHPSAHWLTRLDAARVPAGPVLSIAEMLRNEQARARGIIYQVDHPNGQAIDAISLPFKVSEMPPASACPAPRLGQHTREILDEIGYTAAEITSMIAEEAVVVELCPT